MNRWITQIMALFVSFNAYAQGVGLSIGTDFPYSHYLGFNYELETVDFSYRTGLLVPPYSDAIIVIIDGLGTDEIYINLLEVTYDLGWMNSLGAYFKFGEDKSWYLGPEFR